MYLKSNPMQCRLSEDGGAFGPAALSWTTVHVYEETIFHNILQSFSLLCQAYTVVSLEYQLYVLKITM